MPSQSKPPPGAPEPPKPPVGTVAPTWSNDVAPAAPRRRTTTQLPIGKLVFLALMGIGAYLVWTYAPLPGRPQTMKTGAYTYKYPSGYDKRDPRVVFYGKPDVGPYETAFNDQKGAVWVTAMDAPAGSENSLSGLNSVLGKYVGVQTKEINGRQWSYVNTPRGPGYILAADGRMFVVVCVGAVAEACDKVTSTLEPK